MPERDEDVELLARLRAGDESSFVSLVERYQSSLLRLAGAFVPSQAVAEEVVQDTWIGVIRGIDRFEGRSSFKTWLFRILVNRARTVGVRERDHLSTARLPTVDGGRFDARGQWAEPPASWPEESDARVDAAVWRPVLVAALEELPPRQRAVVLLRDVEGVSNADTCRTLGISSGNQRLLLHRGRARLRARLETKLGRK